MSIKATASAIALALAIASPAYAQTNSNAAGSNPNTAVQTGVSEQALKPGQIRATKMIGAKVYDQQNKDVASVKDAVVDRDGQIAAVVLDPGGGRYVAVKMNELTMQRDDKGNLRFKTSMTQQQLKSAQAFDLNVRNVGSGTSTPPAKNEK